MYENFFLKQNVAYRWKTVPEDSVKQCFAGFFGQSWTSRRSSDAMWRIYSNDIGADSKGECLKDTVVRIATTPQMLFEELRASETL